MKLNKPFEKGHLCKGGQLAQLSEESTVRGREKARRKIKTQRVKVDTPVLDWGKK